MSSGVHKEHKQVIKTKTYTPNLMHWWRDHCKHLNVIEFNFKKSIIWVFNQFLGRINSAHLLFDPIWTTFVLNSIAVSSFFSTIFLKPFKIIIFAIIWIGNLDCLLVSINEHKNKPLFLCLFFFQNAMLSLLTMMIQNFEEKKIDINNEIVEIVIRYKLK